MFLFRSHQLARLCPWRSTSMTAVKRPPAQSLSPKLSEELPSAPAGDFVAPAANSTLLGVVVDYERRRGRGALSNASGPLRAAGAHRLRRRLAHARRTAAVQDHGDGRCHPQDHHPQQVARHRLRPLDQSLSRLRARLHLLLRAADARLSRPVARARFRIQAVREAGCGRAAGEGTGGAELRAERDRDRHQHRSLSADRARATR